MLALATVERELTRVRARLREHDAGPVAVVAPDATRRVVLATVGPGESERVARRLRADGEMAVARPDGGAALRAWHRDTRPVTIADRITVCLAWSEHDRSGLPGLIELGPGGFGSGHHPTTKMLCEYLAARLSGGERILDVGCGSGILALCALELGAARSVATDHKPEAVDAARRNSALNGLVGRLETTDAPVSELAGPFDAVVANIARAGVVALASDLAAAVAHGGWLAVSGITPSQCDQVAGFLQPLREVERRTTEGWSALVLTRE